MWNLTSLVVCWLLEIDGNCWHSEIHLLEVAWGLIGCEIRLSSIFHTYKSQTMWSLVVLSGTFSAFQLCSQSWVPRESPKIQEESPNKAHRDMTRQHAKTTVDMPSGLFPSTCQTRLSPLTCQKSVRRHAKTMVSADMPRNCVRRHVKTTPRDAKTRRIVSVPVNMPKRRKCAGRHAKTTCPDGNFLYCGKFLYCGWFFDISTRGIQASRLFFVFNHVFNHEAILWTHEKTLIVSWSRRSLAPHLDSLTSTCDLQISHFCCFS